MPFQVDYALVTWVELEVPEVTVANAPTSHLLGPLYGSLGGPIASLILWVVLRLNYTRIV